MIITFLGHRSLANGADLFKKIKTVILKNISPSEKTTFYCGGYGAFDHLCAEVCRALQNENVHCEIVFVTPYIISSKKPGNTDVSKYDSVLYPTLEHVPPKFAILRRNQFMIDQADLIIAYVEYRYGGAYTGVQYAMKKQKRIINLAEDNP